MTTTSHAVANEFIRLAQEQDRQLTNMQLQKLVFIAQGYFLAIHNEPLHYHNAHAWQWGPVIPKLYKSLQKYGSNIVTEMLDSDDHIEYGSKEADIIRGVFENYGHYTGAQLSALTHKKNSPWHQTWTNKQYSIIDNELIKNHYTQLIEAP